MCNLALYSIAEHAASLVVGDVGKRPERGFGADPAHPMALQDLGSCDGADALRFFGRWRKTPEFADPGLDEIAFDFEKLRIVGPELLADPVHEPGPVAGQVAGDSG